MQNAALKILIIVVALVLVVYALYYLIPRNDKDEIKESLSSSNTTPKPNPGPEKNTVLQNFMHRVTIETNQGVIEFDTYDFDSPKTVNNFLTLARKGFYSGLIFHRVVAGFVIQGGDPNCASSPSEDRGACGAGGPGYTFEDELNTATQSHKQGYRKGTVAMANAGPNTNGSQFFIMLEDKPLPYKYSIFGKVILGQNVVDTIGRAATGKGDRPLDSVIIKTVLVK